MEIFINLTGFIYLRSFGLLDCLVMNFWRGVTITVHFFHFDSSQSVGGAETGDLRETTPDHPQAEVDLSNM